MPKIWLLTFILTALGVGGCTKFSRNSASSRGTRTNQLVPTTIDEFGAETALVRAGLGIGQEVRVSAESPVTGTIVTFPTGFSSSDIEITIEEAASIATAATASQLGIGESIASIGTAVAVLAKDDAEPSVPYSVTLVMPPDSEIPLQDETSKLIVFYKVNSVVKDEILLGFIPFANLQVLGRSVSFSVRHFGAFQAAYTKFLVTEAKEVTVTTPIQTKRQALEFVPFVVTSRQPFVVTALDLVTVSGTGFRSTMNLTFGGSKVLGVKIESETTASFFAPFLPRFGITDLTASQDGIEQTVTLLYRGIQTDLPIITLAEPQVCSEFKYYDITGALKAGTRGCDTAAASLTDAGVLLEPSVMPRANCWRDGQIDCVTTGRFKSADTDIAAISAKDIRRGKTIGGISGGRPFCNASENLARIGSQQTHGDSESDLSNVQVDGKIAPRGSPAEALLGLGSSCLPPLWYAGGVDSGLISGFCNDRDDQCIFEDLLTKLMWSESAVSPLPLADAQAFCRGMISGFSDWRLPTVMELIQAANNGVGVVIPESLLVSDSTAYYWSVTPNLDLATQNWTVGLADGAAISTAKNILRRTICVRP
jgi:hypothetical protein